MEVISLINDWKICSRKFAQFADLISRNQSRKAMREKNKYRDAFRDAKIGGGGKEPIKRINEGKRGVDNRHGD